MAVAFVSATNNGSGSTNFSVTVPAGSDRYMKVGIVWWGNDVTAVSFDSDPFSELILAENGDGNSAAWWGGVVPGTTEVTANVVVTFSAPPDEGPAIVAMLYTGVDAASPIEDTAQASSTSSNASPSASVNSQVGGLAAGCLYTYNDTSVNSGAGQTRRASHTYNSDTNTIDTEPGAASVTVSFTSANYPALAVVSLRPAAAPSSAQPPRTMHQMRMRRN